MIIHGLHVVLEGARWTADRAVDDFAAAYRAQRAQVPPDFDALCTELRAMPAMLFVRRLR